MPTLEEHFEIALCDVMPMTADERAAALFREFEDMLDELAWAARRNWEALQ